MLLHIFQTFGSVATGASFAAAGFTFYFLAFLQLVLGYSADAAGAKLAITLLYALEAAQLFESLLAPLGYQRLVSEALSTQILVELTRYDLAFVVKIKDVSAALMM